MPLKRLKQQKKKTAVLDLSAYATCRLLRRIQQLTLLTPPLAAADDDEISFTGSSSPAKPTKRQPRPEKGKGKEKQVVVEEEDERDDHQLWVDKYAPKCRVRRTSDRKSHPSSSI